MKEDFFEIIMAGVITPWLIVNRTGTQTTPRNLRVFACQGLYSRDATTATYVLNDANDLWWLQSTGGAGPILPAGKTVTEDQFVSSCLAKFGRYLRYNATAQQELLPLVSTLAGVLDAIPLEDDAIAALASAGASMVFDAVATFAGFSELNATAYVFDHWGNRTTGLAKLNPGWRWDSKIADTFKPTLTGGVQTKLTDYIVKERLFNFFLKDGCIPLTQEHALLERMLLSSAAFWPRPHVVFGYDNSHPLFGGDLFEAESSCSKEHSMGQVASEGVTNLAYFSSDHTVTTPLLQLADPPIEYNSSRTYIAFIIGDGDNVAYVQGSRSGWMKDRARRCKAGGGAANRTACFPLVWSIQPHLLHMAPAWLRWFYQVGTSTGADPFLFWLFLPLYIL